MSPLPILQSKVNAMTTQQQARFFTLQVLLITLCIVVMGGVNTVTAQSARPSEKTVEDIMTASELIQMLTSPIDAQRNRAFHLVTDLAYRSPEVDLTSTVPVLVDIYKNDPGKAYRLAAVSALYAIGDEAGMKQIRERVLQEPSLMVQYVSLSALLDYFGPGAFGADAEAVELARNILIRQQEASRLAKTQQTVPVAGNQR